MRAASFALLLAIARGDVWRLAKGLFNALVRHVPDFLRTFAEHPGEDDIDVASDFVLVLSGNVGQKSDRQLPSRIALAVALDQVNLFWGERYGLSRRAARLPFAGSEPIVVDLQNVRSGEQAG